MSQLLDDANTLVRENEALIGIAHVDHVKSKYEVYLNLTEADLSALNKEECIEAQYILLQYSISINKHVNMLKYKLNINNQLFWRALSSVYNSYDKFMGKELIIAFACGEHAHLREMHDEILKMDSLIKSMENIPEKVEKMTQILKDLSFCKQRN